jgi:hypothetical protein
MCLILHRTLAVFVALIALLAVIISPIVVGLYADVRNWNDSEDGELRWCHDDAKMRDSAANLGLAAGTLSLSAMQIFLFLLLLLYFLFYLFVWSWCHGAPRGANPILGKVSYVGIR